MGGRDGVERVREGTAEAREPAGDRERGERRTRQARAGSDERHGDGRASDEDCISKPGMPARRALEQAIRPDGCRHEHPSQDKPRGDPVPDLPELHDACPDEDGDRRPEGVPVVGVDHAAHEAEHRAGDEEPAAPEHERRTPAVGPLSADGRDQAGGERDQGGGEQPADLPAHLQVEEPEDPRRAAEAASAGPASAADAAQAVVVPDQVEDAVVGRAADIRARGGRNELDDRDPPAGRDDHREAGHDHLPDAAPEPGRRGNQVDERERRQNEEGLHHLGEEPEADCRAREAQPPRTSALERPCDRVGADHEQQDEQRVGIVEAEHQGHDRGDGEDQPGQQSGRFGKPAPDRCAEQADGGDAGERLRQQHAEAREAEDAPRQLHQPERGRRLVDGDEVRRVERAEEKGLPALRAGLDRRGVELVGVPAAREAPEVEECGQREERAERDAAPEPRGKASAIPGEEGLGPLPRCFMLRGSHWSSFRVAMVGRGQG